jgi:hypothetical protein
VGEEGVEVEVEAGVLEQEVEVGSALGQTLDLQVVLLVVGLVFEVLSIFPVLKPLTLHQKWLFPAEL